MVVDLTREEIKALADAQGERVYAQVEWLRKRREQGANAEEIAEGQEQINAGNALWHKLDDLLVGSR